MTALRRGGGLFDELSTEETVPLLRRELSDSSGAERALRSSADAHLPSVTKPSIPRLGSRPLRWRLFWLSSTAPGSGGLIGGGG
jgi:hypothetical protein